MSGCCGERTYAEDAGFPNSSRQGEPAQLLLSQDRREFADLSQISGQSAEEASRIPIGQIFYRFTANLRRSDETEAD
jgi:hypothetical protein